MSKRHNLRLIRGRHCYTAVELGQTLKVNIGTIRRWTADGLKPIDRKRPFLFLGEHLIDFLRSRTPLPIKLAAGELLCVRCNAARLPASSTVYLIPRSPTTVDFAGRCSLCDCGMLRRCRITDIGTNLGPCRVAFPDAQTTISSGRQPHQMSLFEDTGQ